MDSILFRHHDRDRYRKSGGRYRQAQEIDRIRHLIQADSFAAEQAGQIDPADRADKFYDNPGRCQNQRALNKSILRTLFSLRHIVSDFLMDFFQESGEPFHRFSRNC